MSKAKLALTTLLTVFVSAVIGAIITTGGDVLSFNGWTDWKPILSAGIAAVLTFSLNYLNKTYPLYGLGS